MGSAMAGDSQAEVTFSLPASDGGLPIDAYTVTANDVTDPASGSRSESGPASPITVSGLTNGDVYRLTVTASNAAGTGPASATSSAVKPTTTPGAPVMGEAAAGNGRATISFSPPTSNGGLSVTSYTVTVIDETQPQNGGQTATAARSPISPTGLTNGDTYSFTVTATTAAGVSPASAVSNPVVAGAAPTAPTAVDAIAGNSEAVVSFGPPSSDGGLAVTSYTVTATDLTNAANGGEIEAGSAGPLTVTGLTNGHLYRFSVTATNAVGSSKSSVLSNSVRPATG
jgi:Fibronectin type III domain